MPVALPVLVARAAGDAFRSSLAALRRYRSLALPALAGLLTRLWVIGTGHPECTPEQQAADATTCYRLAGDALYARTQGHYLAKGRGFINPVALAFGRERPGAYHPPLFPTVLAGFNRVGIRTVAAQRVGLAVIGVAGVVLVGVVAWRIGGRLNGRLDGQLGGQHGRTTGLIAATIAALCPLLWLNDTQAMSESIYVPLIVAVIGGAYLLWWEPTRLHALVLGLVIGLAWLTRAEAAGLLVLVVAPVLWGVRHLARRTRFTLFGLTTGAAVLVVAPWVAFNLTRFPRPTYVTTSSGDALAYRMCDPAFEGNLIGYYSLDCDPKPNLSAFDESAQDVRSREIATTYLGEHLDRVPLVVAARLGRQWEIFKPTQNARLAAYLDNRGLAESYAGLVSFYLLVPVALIGLRRLWRAGLPISPLVGPIVLVTIVSVTTSPTIRYRIAGDVALLLAASVALGPWWAARVRPRLAAQGRRAARAGPAAVLGVTVLLATAMAPVGSSELAPRLAPDRQVAAPRDCELSDNLQKLYDAYDSTLAAPAAARLSVWAPPAVQRNLDAVVRSDGDLLRIREPERTALVAELSTFARDDCNVFGTQR